MSSEQLADGVNPLDAELAATWDVLKGYSGRDTDLGIARRFGGSAAAYSLRDIGAMNGRVVKARRDVDGQGSDPEEDFSANQVSSGALEDWVNGKLESTLPADVAQAAAAYSLRKVSEGSLVYTGDYSSGADTINANTPYLTVTGNNDGIFGKDNVLKVENDGTVVPQLSTTNSNYVSSTSGVVEFEYYVPSDHPIVGNYWHLGTNRTTDNKEIAYSKRGVKIVGGAWTTAKLFYGGLYGGVDKPNNGRLITILDQEIADGIAVLVNADDGDAYYISSLTIKTYDAVAATIRRSSDGAEVDVHFDSNDKVSNSSLVTNVSELTIPFTQVDSNDTTLEDFLNPSGSGTDAFVVVWKDQAGLNDALQLTAANQPKIAENGALLADGLKFNGNSDNFTITNGVSGRSIFAVTNQNIDTTGGGSTGYGQDGISSLLGTAGADSYIFITNNNPSFNSYAISLDGAVSDSGQYASNGKTLSSAGGNLGTYGDIPSDTNSLLSIIYGSGDPANAWTRLGSGINGNIFMQGSMSEVIFYTTDQTNNRFKIESNINNYYGLYNDANETNGDFQSADSNSSFSANGKDGFTTTSTSSGTDGGGGIELNESVASGDRLYISFNSTKASSSGDGVALRSSLSAGTLKSQNESFAKGFNSFSLLSNGSDADFVIFRDDSGSEFTISDFKVSRIARNGFVETWYDQSGNSRPLIQTTATEQPSIVENGGFVDGVKANVATSNATMQNLQVSTDGTTPNFGTDDWANGGTKLGLMYVGSIPETASDTSTCVIWGGGRGVSSYQAGGLSLQVIKGGADSWRITNERQDLSPSVMTTAVSLNTDNDIVLYGTADNRDFTIKVNSSSNSETESADLDVRENTPISLFGSYDNIAGRYYQRSTAGVCKECYLFAGDNISEVDTIATEINKHYNIY